jgi:Bacterial Ig-like domain
MISGLRWMAFHGSRERRWAWRLGFFALGIVACGGLDERVVSRGAEPAGEPEGNGGTNVGGGAGNGGPLGEAGASEGGSASLAGGAAGRDDAPRVEAVSPEPGEADVEPDVEVRLRFSEALDPATITNESVQLWLGGLRVPGASTYDGETVTFTPAQPLALLANHEVRVTPEVTDEDGRPLTESFTSGFKIREGAWTTEEPIIEKLEPDEFWSGDVTLGVDGQGNTLTAWVQQTSSTAPRLMARWHRPGVGFEAALPLYTSAAQTGTLLYVKTAVSPSGEAALTWFDQTPTGYALWVARYIDGEWGPPERAEGASGTAATSFPPAGPLLGINGERTIVAWLRQEYVGGDVGAYYYLEANDAEHGQPFAERAQVAAGNQGGLGNYFGWADLGMDAAGNALLVFSDFEGELGTVRYSKFAAGSRSWSFDSPVPGASPVRTGPFIAMTEEGSAMIVYEAGTDVSASYYTKAKGFSAPVVLDELSSQAYFAAGGPISTDGRKFVVAWQQPVGTVANSYAAIGSSEGWGPAELVSDGDVNGSGFPLPIADANGNFAVVWSQGGPPNFDVYFARRPAGAYSWNSPQQIRVATPRPYGNFRAAAARNGLIGLAMSVSYQSAGGSLAPQPYFTLFR